MSPDYKAKYFTLDWDNISIDEAYSRFKRICQSINVSDAYLSLSATKGFHVRVHTHGLVTVADMRDYWKDDGRRLVHDILNKPDNIHDVLFTRKTVDSVTWEASPLTEWHHVKVKPKEIKTNHSK